MNALLSSPVLSWLLSYLFNALWQIPLLFAAAWLAARMLRRAHLRVEHRVWVAALLLQIALPACSLHIGTLWASMWVTLRSLTFFWKQPSVIRGAETSILFGPGVAGGNSLHLPPGLLAGVALAYACCVLYFAGRIAWGLIETRTLARSATRVTLTGDTALRCSQYGERLGITAPLPEIAASPQVIGPITVGFRCGLLLLPPGFLETIAPRDLDAVLAHELAHIQRRDFAKNVLYGLVSLPAVWHPLLWRTRARIAESRELVCDAIAADAIAAEAVAGRRQYAQSLLRLASMLARRPAIPTLHAIGILNFGSDARTFERRIMTLTHKRTPMSTTRRFVIAAACGSIALATCTSALALHTDVSALSPAADSAAPAPLHVRSDVMVHQKISGENPTYPKEARAKKIEGRVELALVIDKNGMPQGIHAKQSPSELLTKSAITAVRTWRWRPYLLNGNPIEVDTTVNVIFCTHDCQFPPVS